MNKQKVIKKLLKKAEVIDKCSILEEEFIDVSLEDFLNIKGKIFFDKNKSVFYKGLGEKWFRFKEEKVEDKIENNGKEKEQIAELYSWGNKLKQYVDNKISNQNEEIGKIIIEKFKKLESNQEDFFKEIKDYVDLKVNPVQTVKKEKKKVEKDDKKEVQSQEKED